MYGGTTGRHVARHGADPARPREAPVDPTLGHDMFQRPRPVRVHGGPERPRSARASVRASGSSFIDDDVTYFLGRETIIVTRREGMAIWREKLFVLMAQCGSRRGTDPVNVKSANASTGKEWLSTLHQGDPVYHSDGGTTRCWRRLRQLSRVRALGATCAVVVASDLL